MRYLALVVLLMAISPLAADAPQKINTRTVPYIEKPDPWPECRAVRQKLRELEDDTAWVGLVAWKERHVTLVPGKEVIVTIHVEIQEWNRQDGILMPKRVIWFAFFRRPP
jgi:hypothetical protein